MSAALGPLPLRSDAALLRRFRRGDDAAFTALVARHRMPLRTYVRSMLRGTTHDPDDVTQDVLLRAFEGLRREAPVSEVRPWLFRVAHNRVVDLLRRPARTVELGDAHAAPGGSAEAIVEAREGLRELLRDVAALPDRQRSALLLREVAGLSHVAVADALGVSESASKMLVVRARVTLAEAAEGRATACADIRTALATAADAGTRPDRPTRAHLRTCATCAAVDAALRQQTRTFALLPGDGLGLLGLLTSLGSTGALGGALAAPGSKAAVLGTCAVLAAGGAVAVHPPGSSAPPPPSRAQSEPASPPVRTPPSPSSSEPRPSAPSQARASEVPPAPAPARAQPRPSRRATSAAAPAPTPASPAPAREEVDLSALEEATPPEPSRPPESTPAPSPTPQIPAPPPAAPPEREELDLADLEG